MDKQIETPIYSEEEQAYLSWLKTELRRMADDREQQREEFNGKSYSDFYADSIVTGKQIGRAHV